MNIVVCIFCMFCQPQWTVFIQKSSMESHSGSTILLMFCIKKIQWWTCPGHGGLERKWMPCSLIKFRPGPPPSDNECQVPNFLFWVYTKHHHFAISWIAFHIFLQCFRSESFAWASQFILWFEEFTRFTFIKECHWIVTEWLRKSYFSSGSQIG